MGAKNNDMEIKISNLKKMGEVAYFNITATLPDADTAQCRFTINLDTQKVMLLGTVGLSNNMGTVNKLVQYMVENEEGIVKGLLRIFKK